MKRVVWSFTGMLFVIGLGWEFGSLTMGHGVAQPGSARECDDPDPVWIWCDDFEEDRSAAYFEYVEADGSFTRARGVGLDGSQGMRALFRRGQVDAGNLKLAFGQTPQEYFRPVDEGTQRHREIYWRFYLRHDEGWQGGGGDKLSRATSFVSPTSWAQAMIAHLWSGGRAPDHNYLVLDPASGIDPRSGRVATHAYNDFDNLRWLGVKRGATPLFDNRHVGRWYCLEVHLRLNDPGHANSAFELWIDGEKDAAAAGLDWVRTYEEFGINALFLENYWNQGSPRAQARYFDNLVVSTQPIGCAPSSR